ncbi:MULTISPECIES: AMP-binding protein [Polaromonas]|uniref:AMP-binding protein n=1 Tax=Polaromonas aquatica TaxID=332657 RepID=A0ABW1TZX2_9BURK
MIAVDDYSTIGETFFRAAEKYADKSFLAVPANAARAYYPVGEEIAYGEAAKTVRGLMQAYAAAGYGVGHRIALLLENRPEHMLHKLAMNALGICCVPLNPDHRPRELAYVLDHANVDLVVVLASLDAQLHQGMDQAGRSKPLVVLFENFAAGLPPAARKAESIRPDQATAASILYTSGTTGRPKGCVLSHGYELAGGAWYSTRGGLATFGEACERIYNPLPLFHVNASIFSFYCAMLKGNCQVQTDRFQPSRWWTEVYESKASVVHYLGVVVPMLLSQDPHPHERDHCVRFAIGAGVEPQRHRAFEERFGFPLLEIWGMTEMVRAIVDNQLPREVGTRAFGRVTPGVEVRVVDDSDVDVPVGQEGEMIVRHSAATPRKHFFSAYLDDDAATEASWRGGWFHTGDIITRDATGLLRFVDRRKNIIRRSGENIAAAEVEALLQAHPLVAQVAVLAVKDEVREEEVLACVVLKNKPADPAAVARVLFDHCNANLAYYKAPGWLYLTDSIPTTATQKIQKHQIFEPGLDPRTLPGMMDLRALKKRDARPVATQQASAA